MCVDTLSVGEEVLQASLHLPVHSFSVDICSSLRILSLFSYRIVSSLVLLDSFEERTNKRKGPLTTSSKIQFCAGASERTLLDSVFDTESEYIIGKALRASSTKLHNFF